MRKFQKLENYIGVLVLRCQRDLSCMVIQNQSFCVPFDEIRLLI